MKLRLSHLLAGTMLAGVAAGCGDDEGSTITDAGSVNPNVPDTSEHDAALDASSVVSDSGTGKETRSDAGRGTGSSAHPASTNDVVPSTDYGGSSELLVTSGGPWQQTSAPFDFSADGSEDTYGDCTSPECFGGSSGGGPDVAIVSVSLSPSGLTTVEVPETSCEIQDGCYGGGGTRTVLPFELTITNSGDSALLIGEPWNNYQFHLSQCTLQYRLSNFIKAEVLNAQREVVAVRSLPTSCVADEQSSTFTCSSQGLEVGESSSQPSNSCSGLDVTGLAAGAYTVRFTVAPGGMFHESNSANNTVEVALEQPVCEGEARFCGGVCCPESAACGNDTCLLPDLRANRDAVERSLIIAKQTFGTNACELEEMCITGPGKRRLLQFEGRIENVGTGAVNPGPEEGNPLFEFSSCHQHHHFLDFTDYKLLSQDGSVAVQGHKQSFCLISMDRVEDYESPISGEVVHPEPGETGCNYLEAGWADIYGVGTPCQWVDVTDVAPGDYVLQVAVNPAGKIAEGNVENNVVQVPVHIPADAPCQDEEVCGDVVDQDCDGLPDSADVDCRDSAYCCGDSDRCGLGDNWQCDCDGQPEWEHHDCEMASPDGGYLGGECCSADDTCNWANDGVCDCNGDFEWDSQDCNRVDEFCCQISDQYGIDFCGLAFTGSCECGESSTWDYYDCGGGGPSDAGVPPVVDCCTLENECDYANDGVCDCDGQFAWDEVDCAQP